MVHRFELICIYMPVCYYYVTNVNDDIVSIFFTRTGEFMDNAKLSRSPIGRINNHDASYSLSGYLRRARIIIPKTQNGVE